MILELLAAAFLFCGELGKTDSEPKNNKPKRYGYEETDSFFDSCGNEHFIDDDGFCYECDDYHEEI